MGVDAVEKQDTGITCDGCEHEFTNAQLFAVIETRRCPECGDYVSEETLGEAGEFLQAFS